VRLPLVVLPYERVLNSGAVFHALSRGRPVLAPALGSLPEVAADVGPQWLRLYQPPLRSRHLTEALAWAGEARPSDSSALARYRWETVGPEIAGFVREVAGRGSR
jgi:beta-1,4-mannosyltransferase